MTEPPPQTKINFHTEWRFQAKSLVEQNQPLLEIKSQKRSRQGFMCLLILKIRQIAQISLLTHFVEDYEEEANVNRMKSWPFQNHKSPISISGINSFQIQEYVMSADFI